MTEPKDEQIAAREALAERLRARLADEPSVREKVMFGSRAFVVREKLVACAFKHGHLLARVDAGREAELLDRPGARHAVMAGRDMGAGWLLVDADALVDDRDLAFWLDAALEFNRSTGANP
jgi:hypothetical protein